MADAQGFYEMFVLPAVDDWRKDTSSVRKAMDVACHANALIDHFWHEHSSTDPDRVGGKIDTPSQFRGYICNEHRALAIMRDVADAHKHCELDRTSRRLTSSSQTLVRSMGWGEAEYGIAEFGENHAMVVNLDDGSAVNFARVVWDAIGTWDGLLDR